MADSSAAPSARRSGSPNQRDSSKASRNARFDSAGTTPERVSSRHVQWGPAKRFWRPIVRVRSKRTPSLRAAIRNCALTRERPIGHS